MKDDKLAGRAAVMEKSENHKTYRGKRKGGKFRTWKKMHNIKIDFTGTERGDVS